MPVEGRKRRRAGERGSAREAAKNRERKGRMEEKGILFLCLTHGWDRDKKLNEPAFFLMRRSFPELVSEAL